jgi:hypothetical protein
MILPLNFKKIKKNSVLGSTLSSATLHLIAKDYPGNCHPSPLNAKLNAKLCSPPIKQNMQRRLFFAFHSHKPIEIRKPQMKS